MFLPQLEHPSPPEAEAASAAALQALLSSCKGALWDSMVEVYTGGNPKIGGKPPKMDGENNGKPY